jgi:parallel beta-helix repeat protein
MNAVKAVPKPSTVAYVAGAVANRTKAYPQNPFIVNPGQSIQAALDSSSHTGRWVILKSGVHTLPSSLKIPSGITLAGEGSGTIVFLDPGSGSRDAMVNATNDMQDVTIQDLVIEGALKTQTGDDPNANRSFKGGYNRGGILFRSLKEGQMKNINLLNITIRNCTFNGAFISGADNLRINKCDFNENGGNAVPGPKIQHNLLLTHCREVNISGSRMATSPFGSGIALDHCTDVVVSDCEVARNAWYGIFVSESNNISINKNLIEANDRSGILLEFLYRGNSGIKIDGNLIHYNNGFGVESYASTRLVSRNIYAGNGNLSQQEKISAEKILIMQ